MAAIIGDRPVQWSKTSEKQTEILSGTDARSKRLGNATQRTVVSHTD